MTTRFARPLVRMAVIVGLAAALGACQTMSDLDPTGLLSDDTPAPVDNTGTPDLANVPDAPPTATPDDQKEVASSLAADGAKTQYSADALRAGTEAAAPAPGAAPPVDQKALAAASDAPPSADAPSAMASAAPPPSAQAPVGQPPAAEPPGAEAPTAQGAPAAPIRVTPGAASPAAGMAGANPLASVPANPAAPPVQTAAIAPPPVAAAPPPGAEPAVPAVPPAGSIHGNMMATPAMSDAALGFAPSSAPPLDPSVRNFVSAPILSHYRQTAALGQGAGVGTAAVPTRNGMTNAASAIAAMNGGIAPTAIVYFAGDGIALTAAARSQVRSAVAAFKAGGSAGTVRVVGHASSRTANMPVEKHMEVIFDKSQKRANAVAQALIHEGIPADKVMIEAVGDSQPVYYESMPRGEDGNRRTDIFVQG